MGPRHDPRRWVRTVRRRHRLAVADPERGTSLMELIVGMAIMTIFMAIFTGAVVSLYRTANKAQSISLASNQLEQAFVTLDETVRYASAISTPGIGTDGNWYVELRTTNTGSEVCTQLRVNASGELQLRRVPAGGSADWRLLASGLTNASATSGSADRPFTLVPASGSITTQRLAVVLLAQSGGGVSQTTSRSAYTLVAANSSGATASGVCSSVSRL